MKDTPEIELRSALDPETLLGPGKAALLQAIDETGSIAAAGRRMGMSYKRAWYLIDTMNAYFSEPVVVSAKGGNPVFDQTPHGGLARQRGYRAAHA